MNRTWYLRSHLAALLVAVVLWSCWQASDRHDAGSTGTAMTQAVESTAAENGLSCSQVTRHDGAALGAATDEGKHRSAGDCQRPAEPQAVQAIMARE
ncbi:MAG: hypothetical protein ABI386_08500 [Rhodanobacter sp.]